MKVSLPRVSAEKRSDGSSSASQYQVRSVFQEDAGTLSDSHDRDKAVSVSGEDAGIFGETILYSLLPVENIRVKTNLSVCSNCTFVDNSVSTIRTRKNFPLNKTRFYYFGC